MNKLLRTLLLSLSCTALLQVSAVSAQTNAEQPQTASQAASASTASSAESSATAPAAVERVTLQTNMGNIVIELNREKAPVTVNNFLAYVTTGFYNDTIFHRVINGFMIQGGGLTESLARKPTQAPILNESNNGLSNVSGTIAMARTSDPDSATAQFFINVNDNSNLDYTPGNWGYAVFGKVVDGMSVVNQIKQVSTTTHWGYRDVPAQPIVIEKAFLNSTSE